MKRSKRLKSFGILIPLSVLVFGCPADVEASHTTPRELHVVAVTSGGGIRHALRTNTTWSAFGDVELVAGEIGTISDAEAAVDTAPFGGQLHVVAIRTGQLFHTIRDKNGSSWTPLRDVNAVVGTIGTHRPSGLPKAPTGPTSARPRPPAVSFIRSATTTEPGWAGAT